MINPQIVYAIFLQINRLFTSLCNYDTGWRYDNVERERNVTEWFERATQLEMGGSIPAPPQAYSKFPFVLLP